MEALAESRSAAIPAKRQESVKKKLWKARYKYAFIFPGVLYFIIYKYIPLAGSIIAFQDYNPFNGFLQSEWVGFEHFQRIFDSPEVITVLINTLVLSFLQIVFIFPVPIVLALMLNEVRSAVFKRTVQSIMYLPHFLSWVVVIGIVTIFLRNDGLLNDALESAFGMERIDFLIRPELFKPLFILEIIWKEAGWGTIIFLAALAGVNLELYEAATVDGASRWRRIWHITLPAIRPTIVILLILRMGSVLDSGFEHIFLKLNPFVSDVAQVLDTYVYSRGLQQGDFSYATAVGLFKSVVGLILILAANKFAKKVSGEGVL